MEQSQSLFSRLISLTLQLFQESQCEHDRYSCGASCEGCWKHLMARDLWTYTVKTYGPRVDDSAKTSPKESAKPLADTFVVKRTLATKRSLNNSWLQSLDSAPFAYSTNYVYH